MKRSYLVFKIDVDGKENIEIISKNYDLLEEVLFNRYNCILKDGDIFIDIYGNKYDIMEIDDRYIEGINIDNDQLVSGLSNDNEYVDLWNISI